MSVDLELEGFDLDCTLVNGRMAFGVDYAGRNSEEEIARFFEWCRDNPEASVDSDHGDYPVQVLLDRYIEEDAYSSVSVDEMRAALQRDGWL